jgi:glycine/D-amino acid oxidase-like deaminating enzyme
LQELEDATGKLPLRELDAFYLVSAEKVRERAEWFVINPPAPASGGTQEKLRTFIPDLRLEGKQQLLGPFPLRQGSPLIVVNRVVGECRKSGRFSIWEGVELSSWSADADRVHLDFAGEARETAARLVLALGCWAVHGLHPQPIAPGLRTKRVAACHIEVVPDDSAPALYLGDDDSFLLPLPSEQRWLFGFPSQRWDVNPAQFALDSEDRAKAESILGRYSLELARHRRGARSFCDSYTENWMPVVTKVEERPNVVFAGACSGSGFRLAPGLAEKAIGLLELSPPLSPTPRAHAC